jgi:DNA-binding CsgD family transcriptional regulator
MLLRNEKAFGRKITNKQKEEILKLRASGQTYKQIAQIYNVNRRTIEKLCLGKRKY